MTDCRQRNSQITLEKNPDPDRQADKPEKSHFTTPDTPKVSELKELTSTACSQLKQALQAPLVQLVALDKNNSKAIHNLKKHLLSQQQNLLYQYAHRDTGLLTLSLTGPNINKAWSKVA